MGGTVLSFDGIQVGDKDFKALLTRVKTQTPEALYFGGIYNEGGLLVRQSRELGLKDMAKAAGIMILTALIVGTVLNIVLPSF